MMIYNKTVWITYSDAVWDNFNAQNLHHSMNKKTKTGAEKSNFEISNVDYIVYVRM